MIRKSHELHSFTRSPGIDIQVLVAPCDMFDAGRLYARITIAPGTSMAPHIHEGETESYYIVSGTCVVTDNGQPATLTAGDVLITADGESHSIANETDTPVELIALIVSRQQGVAGRSV